MERALLLRRDRGDEGCFGTIEVPGLRLYTGELPWRDNASGVSCIPAGQVYRCAWTLSPRFRRFMYLVGEIVARAGIRKHAANLMGDVALGWRAQLNGCIALGERLGWMEVAGADGLVRRQKALLLSAPALRRFEARMRWLPFELEIQDAA